MQGNNLIQLDDLNLKIGQIVQIHPNPNALEMRHDCTLVGCLPGESVIITSKDQQPINGMEEGDQIVIRLMSSNGVALFSSVVLYIAHVPVFMVYLDFPNAIRFKLVRSATRVDVALPILVSNNSVPGITSVAGRVSDISLTGARLDMFSNIGKKNDVIEIKGKFDVGDIQRVTSIHAVIKKLTHSDEEKMSYGVQFDEADEDKLIVLFGFIFNSLAFGSVQNVST